MRAKTLILSICFIGLMLQARAFEYPSKSVTLKNGLKVIVCEKSDNDFV